MSKNFTLCGTCIEGKIDIYPIFHQGRVFVQANDIKKIFGYTESTFRIHLDSIVKNTSKLNMLTIGGTDTMLSNYAVEKLLTIGMAYDSVRNVTFETKTEFCDVLDEIQDTFGPRMKSVVLNVNPFFHDRYLHKGTTKVVSLNQFFAEMNIPRSKIARNLSTILLESGCINDVDFYHCDARDVEGYEGKKYAPKKVYFFSYTGCVKVVSQLVFNGFNQVIMSNNLAELVNTFLLKKKDERMEAVDAARAIFSHSKRKNTFAGESEYTAREKAVIDATANAERKYTIGDFEKVMGYGRTAFTLRSLAAYIGKEESKVMAKLKEDGFIYRLNSVYYASLPATTLGYVVSDDTLQDEKFQITKKGVMKFLEKYNADDNSKLVELQIAQ